MSLKRNDMKKVYFIVGPLSSDKFSGGIIGVFKYAEGLSSLGWDAYVVPLESSPTKGWFSVYKNIKILTSKRNFFIKNTIIQLISAIKYFFKWIFDKNFDTKKILKQNLTNVNENILNVVHELLPYSAKRAIWISTLKKHVNEDGLIIATSYDTAYSLELAGIKNYVWFMMHDERLFVNDFGVSSQAMKIDVETAFINVKNIIVNSTWLKERINSEFPDKKIELCLNALEEEYKIGNVRKRSDLRKLRIISYSGRGVAWKGFEEMAKGVKMAKKQRPDIDFQWRVYGTLPNSLQYAANEKLFEELGFITPQDLIAEYLSADVMLSASWYESFPLFPLEGMGLGAAVVATMPGCEDYVEHCMNAYVVEAKNPSSISEALINLADNENLRLKLVQNGLETIKKFSWKKSSENLNSILSNNF